VGTQSMKKPLQEALALHRRPKRKLKPPFFLL
jgi:hypothetical protein